MEVNGRPSRSWDGERLLSLSDLARQPDMPIKRSHWVLRRWAKHGVAMAGTRKRIKLACTVLFGARHSSIEAVREFISKLTGGPG